MHNFGREERHQRNQEARMWGSRRGKNQGEGTQSAAKVGGGGSRYHVNLYNRKCRLHILAESARGRESLGGETRKNDIRQKKGEKTKGEKKDEKGARRNLSRKKKVKQRSFLGLPSTS